MGAIVVFAGGGTLTALAEERLWSPPRVLETHGRCASQTVDVVATGQRRWLAVWDDRNPSCDARPEYRLRIATRDRSSGWDRPSQLPQGFELPALKGQASEAVQPVGGGRVVMLGARPATADGPSQLTRVLQLATVDRAGGFRRRDFDAGSLLYGASQVADRTPPVIDLGVDGRGVAVWARLVDDDAPEPRGQLYGRYRRASGAFGPAVALSAAGQPTAPAVAANVRGDAIAAWCQDGLELLARFKPRGDPWGDLQKVGECGDLATALDVALADDGRIAVAWSSDRSDGEVGRSGVRLALGANGALGPARQLSLDGEGPRVMLTRRAVGVAWSVPTGPDAGVLFARVGPRGGVTEQGVSEHRADRLIDLDAEPVRPRGLLMWGRSSKLLARRIRGNGSLGGLELISSTNPATSFGVARLGLDRSGEAFAIWAHNRIDARGRFRRSTVEAARR